MAWCETNQADYIFGLARNQRLRKIIGREMHQAQVLHKETEKAARVFAQFHYRTRKSWTRDRRVVAKAEYLDKGENPRFVVTSLDCEQWTAQDLYEKAYCARGEMENRIKEQMHLFADRLSTHEMKGNQLRLYFSALAYTMVEALRHQLHRIFPDPGVITARGRVTCWLSRHRLPVETSQAVGTSGVR